MEKEKELARAVEGGCFMEKRKFPRVAVRGMSIDVSDGIGSCSGMVSDISRHGMCLANLATIIGKKTDTYTVVVSKDDRYFKFRVRSRWATIERLNKKMGVEIPDAPTKWTDYVMTLERKGRQS